jgi:imidazolonepropionase-like amidohydrolase
VTHTFSVESLRLAIDQDPDLLLHPNVMSVSWTRASEAQKDQIRAQVKRVADEGIYAGLMSVPEKRQLEIYRQWQAGEDSNDPYLNEIMVSRGMYMAAADYDTMAEGLRVWLDAGVSWTLATDQGPEASDLGPVVWGRLGRAHFDRMVGLQDAGAAPMDILIATTRNGAAAYGRDGDLGTIEPGKLADILVVDADPLADIGNLRSIALVIKEGQVIDRGALPTVKVLDYDPEAPWPY